ncbi:fibronectin [Ciona intestinalis]
MRLTAIITVVVLMVGMATAQLPTPVNLQVPLRTNTMVRVDWSQPASVSYARYDVKITPLAVINNPETPSQTSRTFSELRPGVRYSVELVGITDDGRRSAPLRFHVWSVPEQPSDLTVQPISEINIAIQLADFEGTYSVAVVGMQVDWEPAAGDSALSGYDVQIRPNDGVMLFPQSSLTGEADDTSRIFTGLTPGEEYTVSVRTKTGPPYDAIYSQPITRTTRIPPKEPFSVEVKDVGTTHASLHTLPPLVGVYDPELSFELTPNHGTVGSPSPDPIYRKFDVYTITELRPGTTYTADVYTMSAGVPSIIPYTVTFTTAPAAPLALQVINFTSNSVELRWDQPHKFAEGQEIQYRIEYSDVLSTSGERLTETVGVQSPDSLVNVRIQRLESGVTYKFNITTILNGVPGVLQSQTVQATIPPTPVISTLTNGDGGLYLTFATPPTGRCPRVKVFFSPGLNGSSVTPVYGRVTDTIFLPGAPWNPAYSIHARCVTNNLEGPEATILSSQNPATGPRDTEETVPLACLRRDGSGRASGREKVIPDACCAGRPYRSRTHSCCGSYLLRIGGRRMCCGVTPYVPPTRTCCGGGVIATSCPVS